MADTTVYNAPNNAFFIDLLEHERFLDRYEHVLRGEVETIQQIEGSSNVTLVWARKYPSKMTEQGISDTISFLRTVCEKIMSITNFDEDTIWKLVYQNIQALTDRLVEKYLDYEFRSIADIDEIINVSRNLIIAQIMRSKEGMTLMQVTSNTMISESRNVSPQQQDPNMIAQRPGGGGIINKIGSALKI